MSITVNLYMRIPEIASFWIRGTSYQPGTGGKLDWVTGHSREAERGGLENASEHEGALEYEGLAVALWGKGGNTPVDTGKYRGLKWLSTLPVIMAVAPGWAVRSSNPASASKSHPAVILRLLHLLGLYDYWSDLICKRLYHQAPTVHWKLHYCIQLLNYSRKKV